MGGIWGRNIRLSIFGESHGKAIGINIDGLPSGIELDMDRIKTEMQRRAPGRNPLSTSRAETDEFEILSGFFNGKTTGTPFCTIIRNSDTHSSDYSDMASLMRPGHADYTGHVKYNGFNDYRGGGHFSGRLTAPIVLAGAIAKQILKGRNIVIGSHIKSIGDIVDDSFNYVDIDEKSLADIESNFPVLNKESGERMKEAILSAKAECDSLGGVIECAAVNVPEGIGDPFFDSVESRLSHILFSIPGVKGIEFGAGFEISRMRGSDANDGLYINNGRIFSFTNNNGGILGGITNGMPVIFRVAVKPTPSIPKEQKTVNICENKNAVIKVKGRHDPCIVQRAVPVVEAAAALAILDLLMD